MEDAAGEEGWRGGRESFSLDETAKSAIVLLLGEEKREKEEGGEMERGGESGEGREECEGMTEGLIRIELLRVRCAFADEVEGGGKVYEDKERGEGEEEDIVNEKEKKKKKKYAIGQQL